MPLVRIFQSAEQQETTVSGVLERELDGIASAHIEELSAALPGFAEDGFIRTSAYIGVTCGAD